MGLLGNHLSSPHTTRGRMKVIVCSLLFVAGVSCLPAADPLVPLVHHPLVYHAQNCTNQDETITTKQCLPKTEKECEDVEVPSQRIEIQQNCREISVQKCGLKPVEAEAEEAEEAVEAVEERRRREADPQLVYSHHVVAPVVPLLKHVCEEEKQEYCYPEPKVVEETNTVQKCLFKHMVDCKDVEHKIPKVVCEPVAPLPAPVPVPVI